MKTENYTPDEIDMIEECLVRRLAQFKKMNSPYFNDDIRTIIGILKNE